MKKRNDDLRLECVNWDEEQPATIKSKGRNHAVSRKVLTKAKHPISLSTSGINEDAPSEKELARRGLAPKVKNVWSLVEQGGEE